MGGTAISALTTVKPVDAQGMKAPFMLTAGVPILFRLHALSALLLFARPSATSPARTSSTAAATPLPAGAHHAAGGNPSDDRDPG
jgi:NNP family nitrate/nitrite transporter-like MFS transporter